ncbi:MAG: hypothetical protein WHS89_05960 [Acidimicrobiales bacterium]
MPSFSKIRQRLTATVQQLDQARLQERYQGLDLSPIGEAPLRVPVRIGGEVQEARMVPRAGSPAVEVTISDGTGRATAVFTGRRSIHGVTLGRGIVLEGVARLERGRLVLLNPAYTLL